jgi:hypothetical protein
METAKKVPGQAPAETLMLRPLAAATVCIVACFAAAWL